MEKNKIKTKLAFMGTIMSMALFVSAMIATTQVQAAGTACGEHTEYITEQLDVSEYRKETDTDGYYTKYPRSKKGDEWIFAGWYTNSTCSTALGKDITTDTYTAKFVPAHVLDVKAQVSANFLNTDASDDSTGSLRFVTSVDSLKYSKVGFEVTLNAGDDPITSASNVVYKKLYVAGSSSDVWDYNASELFCKMSYRFKACTVMNISNMDQEISATSFWITKDGTYVPGTTKTTSVNDGIAACKKYVSVNGDDTRGDGTEENPYATLNCAIENVADGGIIMLLTNNTIDKQVDIRKSITIQSEEDITLTRGTDYTGNLFDINVEDVRFTLGSTEENAAGTITVDATSTDAIAASVVYNHQATSTVVLGRNTTITGANSSNEGAALANVGTAYLYGNMTNNKTRESGGAIFHESSQKLYIYAGNYTGNTAKVNGGAIYDKNDGNIIISGGTFSNNSAERGGAVYCKDFAEAGDKLTITGGTFEGNSASGNADSGGAVYLYGTEALITGGTFKDNVATFRGGAIQCNADKTYECVLDITGGTFTGNISRNQGGGAISVIRTTANISGATMTDNVCYNNTNAMGGGALLIQQDATVTLTDCAKIIGNTKEGIAAADTGFDIGFRGEDNANLILTDDTFEGLIGCKFGDATKVNVAIEENSTNALTLNAIYTVDHIADKLVEYVASITTGGETSYYRSLNAAMATANEIGGTGEKEAVVVTLLANATINEQVNIQKNITIQNAENMNVTLKRSATYTGNLFYINVADVTFTLGSVEEDATGSITVDATSANAIDGRTIFNRQETSTVILGRNATLTGAKCSSAGSAFANLGTAHLYGNMTNNSSTRNGGAINHASATGTLYIYGGNYTNNAATGKNGGAIFSEAAGKIVISGGTFSGNKAAKGGAIYCQYYNTVDYYRLTITGGNFEKNEATNNGDSGGAVYLYQTKALIEDGTFKENIATYRGGAIQCNADETNTCTLDITGGTFTGNVSRNQGGGAISVISTIANISGATIQNNVCLNKSPDTYMGGGAILIQSGATVTLSNCTINDNTTVGEGNAVAGTGFDIGFRGQSSANLILAGETFDGSIGWVFGDDAVNVTIGNNSPITLTKGIYTVDYANKKLISTSNQ